MTEPPFARWVRAAARDRVEQVRVRWQRRLAGVHAGIDEILRDPPAVVRDPAVDRAGALALADPAFARLVEVCGLGLRECEWLALLAACQVDPQLTRVLGYLDDDLRPAVPTPAVAASLWGWPAGDTSARDGGGGLVTWCLAQPADGDAARPDTPWTADPDVVGWLCGADGWWRWHAGLTYDPPQLPCLHPALRDEIAAVAGAMTGPVEIELVGPAGSGRRTFAAQLAAALGRPPLLVDDAGLGMRALRTARLLDAVPIWSGPERVPLDARPDGVSIVAREAADPRPPYPVARLSWPMPQLSGADRRQLWEAYAPGRPVPATVAEWTLTPAEIATAALQDGAGAPAASAGRGILGSGAGALLNPVPCPYTWDDLVVADTVAARLREVETQVRLRTAVLDEWDFGRLTPGSRGVTALFAGPSGTGKTMAAQILARSLELDLFRIDLAQVVDKYIGETEKRLAKVFDECERRRVLLLFDEADALFGQRTRVRDAHDRFANIEIDYLLQRMESFSGLAVLATNRKGDLDQAFMRRLRVVVDFLPPTADQRARLWRLALPAATRSGVPVCADVDHDRLAADLTLTGAEIKSVTLAAAYLARAEGELIGMRHVLAAARSELAKRGTVLRTDLPVNGMAVAR
ncbi:ATPase [Catellatospora sp. TT07R-123]|uniref:ATP-binding protein n=1 Tax=Catellatospora sp. TT07R-123 TaxID=2733863 RepID=UPI001B01F087|nr:ATP-binding protein [Catellatospora sp. TT07R-123]GHJ47496.1 ATPase [Catellatospora sp. TT07R-123]